MVVKVTSDEFKGLENQYTGKAITVMMSVTPAGVFFFASPGDYSPADVVSDSREAYRLWSRRKGIEGVRSGVIRCAYTGEPLSLVHTGCGVRYNGGFDIHMMHTREDFLYYVTMRDGHATRQKPGPCPRVKAPTPEGEVTDRMRAHAEASQAKLTDDHIRVAEEAAKAAGVTMATDTVSMSVPSKKRRGRR